MKPGFIKKVKSKLAYPVKFVISILGIGVLFYLIVLFLFSKSHREFLSITISFLTFVAVIWYTYETYKMQRAIAHQLDVEVSPYLSLVRVKTDTAGERDKFELKNLGNGTALNISIDDVKLCSEPLIILKFFDIPYLQPNEKSIIHAQNYQDNEPITPGFGVELDEKYSDNNHEVTLRYFDVLNRQIIQKLTLGKSGLKFVKQNKKD